MSENQSYSSSLHNGSESSEVNRMYQWSPKASRWSIGSMVAGAVLLIAGYFIHPGNPQRIWGNLEICSYYFVALCLGGLFFYAVQYTAKSGWSAVLIRVPSAFSNVLPIAGSLLLIVIAGGIFTGNLYQSWAAPGISDPHSPHFDPVIYKKSGLLNVTTFFSLLVFVFIVWTYFARKLRALSVKEDREGTSRNMYKTTFTYATVFLAFFAISSAMYAFMVMMSNEAKEFSTMYAWYNFAGIWVSSLAVITLVIILLKENGYYKDVNENHLQNLGTLMFAFTVFFTYTWFFQFMLTWYSNLPEESFYITQRWDPSWGYKWPYWINVVICFVIPFFGLITSDAKRNFKYMKVMCIVIILGHWLDWFLQVMPGTVGGRWGIDLPEIGAFLLFSGLFLYAMLWSLSKIPLSPKNHPFMEESLHHHIENV